MKLHKRKDFAPDWRSTQHYEETDIDQHYEETDIDQPIKRLASVHEMRVSRDCECPFPVSDCELIIPLPCIAKAQTELKRVNNLLVLPDWFEGPWLWLGQRFRASKHDGNESKPSKKLYNMELLRVSDVTQPRNEAGKGGNLVDSSEIRVFFVVFHRKERDKLQCLSPQSIDRCPP